MKHGLSKTSFQRSHNAMKQRCSNPNHPGYKDYGGRGIIYCEKWETLVGFADDMFDSYIPGLTIERLDVNGMYCKENCIWIPKNQQWKNKRNIVFITHGGITKSMSEWAKEYGINRCTFAERLSKGWPFESIIYPKKHHRSNILHAQPLS